MIKLDIPGDELVTLDKKRIAFLLWGQASVMFIGGVEATLLGYYIGILIAAVALPLIMFGRMLGTTRLVATTEGVYHVRAKGVSATPMVVAKRAWSEISEVSLVSKTSGSGSRQSTSHTLVFECKDGKPLRYLTGWPQTDRIAVLAAQCKQRGIALVF